MNYGSKQIRKKIKSLRSPYEKIGRKAVVLFFKLITVCIVVCFVMLTCVGLGAFTGIIETAPQISLDAVSPQWYQSYIYDSNGNKVETLFGAALAVSSATHLRIVAAWFLYFFPVEAI